MRKLFFVLALFVSICSFAQNEPAVRNASGAVFLIKPDPLFITALADPQSISVVNGTAFGSVPVPSTVRATYNTGVIDDAAVSFSAGSYDGNTNGSYTVTGTVSGTALTVSLDIWVLPAPTQWFDCIDYSLMAHTVTDDNLDRIVTSATAKVGSSIAQGSAALGNRPSWNGDGIYCNTQSALLWGTTSSHNTFHQDTPWTIYVVWYQLSMTNTHLGAIYNSNNGSSTNTGIALYADNRSASSHTNALLIIVTKGVGGQIPINVSSSNGAITQNAWNWVKLKFDGTDFTAVANGSTVATSTPSIAFSVGNATSALMVANLATIGASTGMSGYLKHIYMEDSFVSGATETLLDSWADAMTDEGIVPENANVYLRAGQSNAAGRGLNTNIAGDLTGSVGARIMTVLPTPPSNTSGSGTINSQSYWAQLTLGVNQTFEFPTTLHGTEMRFGKSMWDFNKNCYIIKLGVGGSPIVSTASFNDWNISTAQLYAQNNTLINTGLTELQHVFRKNPIIRGLSWYQGETDAGIAGAGSVYKANLTNFINGTIDAIVTSGYTVNKLRIIIYRISQAGGVVYDPTEFPLIQTAQEDIGDDYLTDNPSRTSNVLGTAWRTTDDLSYNDLQHITAGAHSTLGTYEFEYFKQYWTE